MNHKIAVCTAVFCLLPVLSGCSMVEEGQKLDAESKKFTEEVVPLMTGSCDSPRLAEIASPELLEVTSMEKLQHVCRYFSKKLGRLKNTTETLGDVKISFLPKGQQITATYMVESQFEKGIAQSQIVLIRHNDKWQVLSFYLNSDALLE